MTKTKRIVSLLLVLVLALGIFAACDKKEEPKNKMAMLSVEDLKKEPDKYLILDVRKAEAYAEGHIEGAVPADLDVIVSGKDVEKGKDVLKAAIKDNDKPIVLVCNSGASYAQAGTDALAELGQKMDDVFTLEGGMKAWTEKYPEDLVK